MREITTYFTILKSLINVDIYLYYKTTKYYILYRIRIDKNKRSIAMEQKKNKIMRKINEREWQRNEKHACAREHQPSK